jgi:hypothetical protein
LIKGISNKFIDLQQSSNVLAGKHITRQKKWKQAAGMNKNVEVD